MFAFKGRILDPEICKAVIEFYKEDAISATMPGKKDVVAFRDDHGHRIALQKRLLLGTLREIYANFKERNPDFKIGFTKFSLLHPRECVFVRNSGTHTVCVCTTHQNAKLSILSRLIFEYSQSLKNY